MKLCLYDGRIYVKNIDIIRTLSIKELSILLVRKIDLNFVSPSGREFSDYDDAVGDCANWLNTNCEQTVNDSKNGKNFDL
jgi:hypothetical protein